ncbi:MAG TPA: cytochrome C oxidase subunit IV family protein [Thermoanaerobaculia bacterium]
MSEHVVPVKIYVAVFVTLLVMTAATTAISGINLGPWNTVVALGIAVFKASLVVLFFMHARYSPRLTHMVILAGLFWLALLLLITFSDFASRGWLR